MIRPQMLWPVWPGCALLVAGLLLTPRRIWPILIAAGVAGFFLYDLQVGLPLRPTLLLILTDIAEVLIAALGVSYSFDGVPQLNSLKSLVRYSFFAVILAPLAAASIATAAFSGNYWVRWRIGFFTEALALLTLTPAILGWVSAAPQWVRKSRAFYLEGATLIAGLSLLGYVAFVAPGRIEPPLAIYSLLPLLLWAALRFGLVGISTSMIVVAFQSVWGAVHGRGPFTGSEPLTNVMSLQLFLFFAATTFMVLAVLVEEQKETDRAFRESEKRFRLMADTAPALIWMAGTDKLCTYFNKPWLDFTGRSIELELGDGWGEGVHPEDLRRCMDTYTQAFDRREEFRMEYRLRRHDGEYRWVLDIGVPRLNQDRSFAGYIGVGVDVTDRKLAEERLREYEKAVEGSEEMIAVVDREYRYQIANRKFLNLRNMTKEQVIGRLVREILNDGVFEAGVKEKLDECFRGKVVRYELKYTYPGLGKRDIFVSYFPIEGATGIDRVACIMQDITDRKRGEEALRKSEERFRLAAQAGKMYAFEWDVASDMVVRSEENVNILGLSDNAKQLTRQQLVASIHPDDHSRFLGSADQLTPESPTTHISYRLLRSDGAVVWLEKSARGFFDEQGKLLRMIGMVANITERKRVEEALRESEERFRLAAHAGKMFAYEWDAATDVIVRSAESGLILGIDETAEITGQQTLARVHPEDREGLVAAVAALSVDKPSLQVRYRMLHPDGSVIWVERNSRAHFDEQGKLQKIVGMVVDVTERKRSEDVLSSMSRRLIDAQEKERARIARELHDDMGQRLALLANELEQLLQNYPDLHSEVRNSIRELQKDTFQIANDAQSLSHELHSSKLEYLGIVTAMKGFCQEFGRQRKVKIDFKNHEVPSPLPPDISLCLFRVLQEALHNSVKHSGVRHIEVELWGMPDEIHLTVHDAGTGFDSKAAKESRGLGLVSMEERLRLVEGKLSIESQPKRGTTIHARVPLRSGCDPMRAAG